MGLAGSSPARGTQDGNRRPTRKVLAVDYRVTVNEVLSEIFSPANVRRLRASLRPFFQVVRDIVAGHFPPQLVCSLNHKAVPAGHTVEVKVFPQARFHVRQMAILDGIAEHFEVWSVKVGRNAQTVNAGMSPAALFSSKAAPVPVKWEPCEVGECIAVTVRNKHSEPVDFWAILVGEADG